MGGGGTPHWVGQAPPFPAGGSESWAGSSHSGVNHQQWKEQGPWGNYQQWGWPKQGKGGKGRGTPAQKEEARPLKSMPKGWWWDDTQEEPGYWAWDGPVGTTGNEPENKNLLFAEQAEKWQQHNELPGGPEEPTEDTM